MRKGRVELYQQLGYLADLLLLARTDPPPFIRSGVLELCLEAGGFQVVTINAEESYGGGCGYPTAILWVL